MRRSGARVQPRPTIVTRAGQVQSWAPSLRKRYSVPQLTHVRRRATGVGNGPKSGWQPKDGFCSVCTRPRNLDGVLGCIGKQRHVCQRLLEVPGGATSPGSMKAGTVVGRSSPAWRSARMVALRQSLPPHARAPGQTLHLPGRRFCSLLSSVSVN